MTPAEARFGIKQTLADERKPYRPPRMLSLRPGQEYRKMRQLEAEDPLEAEGRAALMPWFGAVVVSIPRLVNGWWMWRVWTSRLPAPVSNAASRTRKR